MSNTYTEMYYHFVWATKDRNPFITEALETPLYNYIRCKMKELRVEAIALNGMPDHVHLACSLPTSISVGEFMKAIKGGSAHYFNHVPDTQNLLFLQPGYGVLTFSKKDLPHIQAYIDGQKQHHAHGTVSAKLERCAIESTVSPEPGLTRQ